MGIRSILLFSLFFLTLSYVEAQSDSIPPTASNIPPPIFGNKKFVFGINTQFAIEGLFDQQLTTPLEVTVRKLIKNNQVIRLRLMGISSNRSLIQGDTSKTTKSATLGIAIGKEWHRPIGKKFGWYFGFEAEFNKNWDNSIETKPIYNLDGILRTNKQYYDRSKLFLNGLGIIGFSFRLNSYIILTTEIKQGLYYSNFQTLVNTYDKAIEEEDYLLTPTISKFSIEEFKLSIQPYTGIHINF